MNNEKGIDFIGDIHGHADELENLLIKLGYVKDGNGWKHLERIAFFVGDYIDRGPKIRETLYIVRQMVEMVMRKLSWEIMSIMRSVFTSTMRMAGTCVSIPSKM